MFFSYFAIFWNVLGKFTYSEILEYLKRFLNKLDFLEPEPLEAFINPKTESEHLSDLNTSFSARSTHLPSTTTAAANTRLINNNQGGN